MKQKPRSRINREKAKTVLRLPDLEHAKAAVLKSLTSATPSAGIVMPSVQTTERYLGRKQRIRSAVNDRIGIELNR